MKLSERYNRVNLVTTILVLLLTGIIYYQAISLILTNQKDRELVVEENEIFEYVKLNHKLPQTFESNDQQITFVSAVPGSVTRQFINTEYFEKWGTDDGHKKHKRQRAAAGEFEPGRGLISSITVGKNYYKIIIIVSKVETEDLIRIIFFITGGVILLLLLVLFVANRIILNKLWQPFYKIMKEIRLFNLTDAKEIPKLATHIDEFDELNNAVTAMTSRAKSDYKDLKAFTENASHELLTPIAVINSKLDTLLQTGNFSEKQSNLLGDLYSGVSRLSRLNQSLLLLVKLENNLLHDHEPINLRVLVDDTIVQFDEIFADKELKVGYTLDDKEIYANRYLVEILLNNLISNAIRHNHKGGAIEITLTAKSLVIKNTGEKAALTDKIFTRFHKSSGSEGSGLGLTISRQICEKFQFFTQLSIRLTVSHFHNNLLSVRDTTLLHLYVICAPKFIQNYIIFSPQPLK